MLLGKDVFSPLVESEPLCDNNVRFDAAEECARATISASTTAAPYGSELWEGDPALFLIQGQLHVN